MRLLRNSVLITTVILLVILLNSCSKSKESSFNTSSIQENYQFVFSNEKIDSVISEYVKLYDVNPDNRLLLLRFYRDPLRNFYYLTQTSTWSEVDDAPDYFFIHDDKFIVLLFTGDNIFFTSTSINRKIELAMIEYGVKLPKERFDNNPPIWEILEECDGVLELQEKSVLTMNFLPCGYKVEQDSIGRSIFYLIRP